MSPGGSIPSGGSVLIVLTGSLGDIARGLSVAVAIRESDPTCKITWLVEKTWRPFVEICQGIDELIVFDRKRGVSGFLQTVKELRAGQFDVCLDMQRILKSGLFSFLSGAKKRIGFHRENAKELNWLFNSDHISSIPDTVSKFDHYLAFLEYLGLSSKAVSPKVFADFNEQSYLPKTISDSLVERSAIAIVLGSSWESKDWFESGYASLIQILRDREKENIILLGDRSQERVAGNIEKALGSKSLFNLVGKTSLIELTAILKASIVAIGPDSGPGHIAATVGTPYVSIFGPTPPVRVAPRGSENLVVRADIGCSPCYKKKCPGLDRLCMRLVSPEAVYQKVSSVLQD